MAKLLVILIVVGALSEGLAPSQPPLLIDAAPAAAAPAKPLDVTA
jgi:hypothetical protein